jgi:hypothetical protein
MLVLSVGFVFQETGDLKNRYHRLPSARRNGKTAPIIQQQMQDNIQWIKVRRKIN